MRESGTKQERISIPYFEGVNSTVQQVIARRSELSHSENARAPMIGVLEKREGQSSIGSSISGQTFITAANYGITYYEDGGTESLGLIRVTSLDGTSASIYFLNQANKWQLIQNDIALNMTARNCSFSIVEDNLLVVNGIDPNKMIVGSVGNTTEMIDSTTIGSLYRSPAANKAAYYKSRIYLANYYSGGEHLKTTVLRSSYAMGLISLISGDFGTMASSISIVSGGTGYSVNDILTLTNYDPAATTATVIVTTVSNGVVTGVRLISNGAMNSMTTYETQAVPAGGTGCTIAITGLMSNTQGNEWKFDLTDTKYIYADAGMNHYEIYRGNLKVATVNVRNMTETSIYADQTGVTFESGFSSILSSDEVWISGTFSGKKQYRWTFNASTAGRNTKQYDTFKLTGGSEDEITLLEPVGNILMIANKNSMMTWNDYTLENFDLGVGNVSKNGYTKLKGAIYFLHYSGVYSTSGSVPQLISRKIERYIKGATKAGLENAAAGYKGLSIFFTIGDVTLYKNDGSIWKVLDSVCLEYNIADQNWYVHTNVTATQFSTYMQTDGKERLTMCSIQAGNIQENGDELLLNGSFIDDATDWSLDPEWNYTTNSVTLTLP